MAVVRNLMVRAGADFSAITSQAQKASKAMRGMQNSVSRSCNAMTASLSGLKKALGAVGVAVSLTALVSVARECAEAYDAQVEAETKLATAMRNTMNATNAQIQSVLDLCSAQQRLGIVEDDTQKAGAQKLSTFLSETSSLKSLIPVMNDVIAAQYGYNATAENATSVATMMGKALKGNIGAMTRYGFSFTEAQESIMKYGTEAQRAATLSQVISNSVGGMNRSLAQTPTGRMVQLSNVLGDIKEKFGQCVRTIGVLLLPLLYRVADILEAIANWANKAANSIAKVFGNTAALTGWQSITSGILPAVEGAEDFSEYMDDAETSAEKTRRSLMSFDKLNILNGSTGKGEGESGSGGSSGAGSGTGASGAASGLLDGIGEDMEGLGSRFEKILQNIKDHAGLLKDTVAAVAAGFAGWKIARSLGADLTTTVGVASALYGAVNLVAGGFRAWTEGINFDNMREMFTGTIALSGGLLLAFKNLKAGAVGLAVGGLTMLVTAGREWYQTGQLTGEAFTTMETGILSLGSGLALLTGSWIPLAIAAVAAVGVAIYTHWEEIKGYVTEGVATVTTWISEAWAWVRDGALNFAAQISACWQFLWDQARTVYEGIKTSIITAAQNVWTFLTNAWSSIKSTTVSVFTTMKTHISEAMTTAKINAIAAVTAARTAVTSQWTALLASCKSIFQSIRGTVISLMGQTAGYLQSQSWYSYGVNLMQGFFNGLRSLMSTIQSAVVSFCQRMAAMVRSALRIGSPSKVFEEIGAFTGEGFVVGLQSQQGNAEEAAKGLAGGTMAAAAETLSRIGQTAGSGYAALGNQLAATAGGLGDSGDTMGAMLQLLQGIENALRSLELSADVDCDGERLFQIVVSQNNRAINRTGMSPIRV